MALLDTDELSTWITNERIRLNMESAGLNWTRLRVLAEVQRWLEFRAAQPVISGLPRVVKLKVWLEAACLPWVATEAVLDEIAERFTIEHSAHTEAFAGTTTKPGPAHRLLAKIERTISAWVDDLRRRP